MQSMVLGDKDKQDNIYSNTIGSGDREIWILLSSNDTFSNFVYDLWIYYCANRQREETGVIEISLRIIAVGSGMLLFC